MKDHEYKVLSGKIHEDLILTGPIHGETIFYPFLGIYRVITTIAGEEKHEVMPIVNSIDHVSAKEFTKIIPRDGVTIVINDPSFNAFENNEEININFDRELVFKSVMLR